MTTLQVEVEANSGLIASADFDVGFCLRNAIIPEFLDGVGNPGWRRRTVTVSAAEGATGFDLPRDFLNMEGIYPQPNYCGSAKGITFIGDDPAKLAAARVNTTPYGPCGYFLEYTPSAVGLATSTVASLYREVPTGVIDGVNKVFIIEYTPVPGWTADLFLNQTKQYPKSNIELPGPIPDFQYTISGTTITYEVAPRPGDVHEITYWRDVGSGSSGGGSLTPRWFQRVGFQAPLDKPYTLVAVYYCQVPFPDNVTEIDLSQYIPENFQYALVYGLRRNIYTDRYGQGDKRAEAAAATFLKGIETAKRGDMELARVHRPRFIR